MTITITSRKGKQTIRATGKDAQALFDAMCRTVGAKSTAKTPANAPKPLPNRPREEIQGDGAAHTAKAFAR
ncbi:MAG: hypothetical protein ACT4NV_18050 [Rhodoferax sp.]